MTRYIHPNAPISSTLLRVSAVLTIVDYFFVSHEELQSQVGKLILSIIILIGSAYLIRNGYNWIRWALSVLFLLGIIQEIMYLPATFRSGLITTGSFAILQSAIQITAVALLFFPYNIPATKADEPKEITD